MNIPKVRSLMVSGVEINQIPMKSPKIIDSSNKTFKIIEVSSNSKSNLDHFKRLSLPRKKSILKSPQNPV